MMGVLVSDRSSVISTSLTSSSLKNSYSRAMVEMSFAQMPENDKPSKPKTTAKAKSMPMLFPKPHNKMQARALPKQLRVITARMG